MLIRPAEDVGILQDALLPRGVAVTHEGHEANIAHGGEADLARAKVIQQG